MVALRKLIEQGCSLAELQERAKDDLQLEQELIWLSIQGMEPVNDDLKRLDLWPGRIEQTGTHRKSYHHGTGRAITKRPMDINRRAHRPFRHLSECWPNHRIVVEVQIRGANGASNRIPTAYHIDKTWYDADTGKPIRSIVERWRALSAK